MLPDMVENLEDAAERQLDDAEYDGETVLCRTCKKRYRLEDGVTLSPDPYAFPMCPRCNKLEIPNGSKD